MAGHPGSDNTYLPLNGTVSLPQDTTIRNSTIADNDTMIVPQNEAPPGSDYALYDNFNTVKSGWTKRDESWKNGFANVKFQSSNVKYSDGKIQLLAYVGNHSGSELDFMDSKFSFGTYKASMKLNQTPGSCMAFFSYQWSGNNVVHNEIDIEMFKNADGSTMAMFSNYVNHVRDYSTYTLPFDPSAGYHTYAYKWYSDHVEYYIDDMSNPVWTSHKYVPQNPMYLEFQDWTLQNPGNYGCGYNQLDVDWVTVEPI